jgi:hypothetical protein
VQPCIYRFRSKIKKRSKKDLAEDFLFLILSETSESQSDSGARDMSEFKDIYKVLCVLASPEPRVHSPDFDTLRIN